MDLMDSDSSACRALSTDLIIRKILSNLDTSTLLHRCRLVNQKFYKEATSILKFQRGPLWLKRFDCSQEEEFNKLCSLAANSKDFPFTGLNIHAFRQSSLSTRDIKSESFQDLETPGARSFFQSYGPCFTHLWLNNFLCSSSNFVKLFCSSYLPNIETLELGSFLLYKCQAETNLTDFGSTLPMLRRITIRPAEYEEDAWIRPPYLEGLLRAAVNLEVIDGDIGLTNSAVILALCETNSWNKVRSLTMTEIYPTYHLKLAEMVAQCSPSCLIQVYVGRLWEPDMRQRDLSAFINCVCAIIRASRNTLEFLSFNGNGYVIPVFDMPVMFPRLSRIDVSPNTKLHMPDSAMTGHKLIQKFPALKGIRLK